MKTHTSAFKENIKKFGRELGSIISYELEGGTIELGGENLNSVTPHYQSAILKSVMKQLDIDSNVDVPIGTELNYQFGIKINNNYEYLEFGNYIVYSSEKQEDTNSYKIVCYDKMLYSMKDYKNIGVTYPITIRSYINAICTYLGLTFANSSDTFANYDKQIPNELYLSSDGTSLDYTFRDVLDELAQVTASTICINDDDELEVRYINDTEDTIDEEYLKDVNVNFGEKFGPVNVIVLSRSAGSDNIYYPAILPENPCEIKISDNQIMNGNNRSEFLPDIYNALNGLEYYTNDFISTGICYYNLCDRYNVTIGENTYPCVMFNDEVNATQGLEEHIYTDIPEETETDYTKADKTDRKINQTYLIVDKQNQLIQSLIDSSVYISNTINGTGSVTLENAYKGRLYELSIKGQMSLLYPQDDILYGSSLVPEETLVPNAELLPSSSVPYQNEVKYPNSDLYPIDMILLIDDIEYPLNIGFLNYIDNDVCDEFLYHDGEYKVIRRVGIDSEGNKYALENEFVDETGYIDLEVDTNSLIRLKSFGNGIYKATYLLDNQYTNVFATKVELSSSITQTAEEINLKVNKKVGNDEVISKINQSAEQIQINANKISLEGKQINLTSDNIIINSTNFSVDEDGKITGTAGDIAGFEIDADNGFVKKIYAPYDYTEDDFNRVREILTGQISPTEDDYIKYDFDENGEINSSDLLYLNLYLINGITTTSFGQFIITAPPNTKNLYNAKLGYVDAYGGLRNGFTPMGANFSSLTIKTRTSNTQVSTGADSIRLLNNNTELISMSANTGNITCVSLTQTSKEENKKNFEKLKNAKDILQKTDIYKYNLKTDTDGDKKHIGFVIGDKYNYSEEITSKDNDGVDVYSMVSVLWQAVKEQQEIIENLKERIEKLERESDK